MRRIFTIVVLAALAWGGYWFFGSDAAETAFENWFEERRAEGWVAEYDELQVRGFPSRFDAGFEGLRLADPDTGLAWTAPFFQILALSYRPNHVIAVWPDSHRVATPLAKYDVTSEDMRASLKVEPQTDLALERLSLTANALSVLEVGTDSPVRVEALSLAMEQTEIEDAPRYRLGLSAQDLSPGADWQARLDPRDRLPDRLGDVRVDMTVLFDKPWDLDAIEEARPQPREIDLRLAEATWGSLRLAIAGEVEVDESGLPTGDIMVKARNWREILEVARNSGALPDGLFEPLSEGLGMLAQLSGNPETLDIPLALRNGRVWLGPAPIAKAPVLRLR
ncbi:DUF2125 domain-containing protein [Roseovarius sp. SCSIO 43702]|uniref:DUF2125 domain-containing protein n=1 Tax=Roseovarius sp. SCSIO 43702 TaxID=2823043 RepID=UPI001C72D90C|nr:DUF2125 domain-containing protein [Roseovarius sp. SCSIO 43702]QYX56272.1 DUF2125 domain-containing protein [Roseovarius sp. SCSIO 43702]